MRSWRSGSSFTGGGLRLGIVWRCVVVYLLCVDDRRMAGMTAFFKIHGPNALVPARRRGVPWNHELSCFEAQLSQGRASGKFRCAFEVLRECSTLYMYVLRSTHLHPSHCDVRAARPHAVRKPLPDTNHHP